MTWARVAEAVTGEPVGTFVDEGSNPPSIYHATGAGVFAWMDGPSPTVTQIYSGPIRSFAGGRDPGTGRVTLAVVSEQRRRAADGACRD